MDEDDEFCTQNWRWWIMILCTISFAIPMNNSHSIGRFRFLFSFYLLSFYLILFSYRVSVVNEWIWVILVIYLQTLQWTVDQLFVQITFYRMRIYLLSSMNQSVCLLVFFSRLDFIDADGRMTWNRSLTSQIDSQPLRMECWMYELFRYSSSVFIYWRKR